MPSPNGEFVIENDIRDYSPRQNLNARINNKKYSGYFLGILDGKNYQIFRWEDTTFNVNNELF